MNLYQFCGESARVNGSGLRYAVADAYERWSDVDESEMLKILKRVGEASP